MNKTRFLILFVAALLAGGCDWAGIKGNGQLKTEQRPIGEFSEIHASGMFRIEWRNGAPALEITTDENLLPYLENKITDNRLRLRSRERLRPTKGIKVILSSPTRLGAKLTGATELVAEQLTGDTFAVQTTGASEVKLDGTINTLLADMTGASELNAKSLQTKTAKISTTGAADAQVAVSDTLQVSITGAGEVSYYGNPKTIEKNVTGAGSIHKKD